MASIGPLAVTKLRGTIPGWRRRTTQWMVPGVNGIGVKQLGLGPDEFRVEIVYRDTAAAVAVWEAALEALVGTVVPITDDWGRTRTYCVITMLGPPQRRADGTFAGGCIVTIEARGYVKA